MVVTVVHRPDKRWCCSARSSLVQCRRRPPSHWRDAALVADLRLVFYRQSLTGWLLRRQVVGFELS